MNIEEIGKQPICWDCVGDPFIKRKIQEGGGIRSCFKCEESQETFLLVELADAVEQAIEAHFEESSSEPEGLDWYSFKETGEWEPPGELIADLIADRLDVNDGVAEQIRKILEDRHFDRHREEVQEQGPFDEATRYTDRVSDEHSEHHEIWARFEAELKYRARYFNKGSLKILRKIFANLKALSTDEGGNPVVTAGPNTEFEALFRARYFENYEALEKALRDPAKEVGTPPRGISRPGRMNAHGVSVFYGAKSRSAAIAEIRPPVGSQVITARFILLRPLRLLDVSALQRITVKASIFDPTYWDQRDQGEFLRSLSIRITRPVMPNDEAFDYLPTQAVAEFLADEYQLDGMIYDSAQASEPRANVVLFQRSAEVAPIKRPEGTEVRVSMWRWTDDGSEPNYDLEEIVPGDDASIANEPLSDDDLNPLLSDLCLELDWGEIWVSKVKRVEVETADEQLTRVVRSRSEVDSLSQAEMDDVFPLPRP